MQEKDTFNWKINVYSSVVINMKIFFNFFLTKYIKDSSQKEKKPNKASWLSKKGPRAKTTKGKQALRTQKQKQSKMGRPCAGGFSRN